MSEIYLQQLGGNHAKWLAVRQSLIASNIANANVPGFEAKDVRPLEESQTKFSSMVQTHENHVVARLGNVEGVGITEDATWETYYSGGNVSLPQEMMKSAEVASAFRLNTSVMRSFHGMVLTVFGN
ncbi:MAG: flagellar basal body protein [Pseudomonadota bacterium]